MCKYTRLWIAESSPHAESVELNRSGLYYLPVGPSSEEVEIKKRIDEIYAAYPFYGSRRITAQLNHERLAINRKAVQRHMREMGIAGICPGPNLSKRNHEHQVFPYLLREIAVAYPNHIWGTDITCIRLRKGWMYLTVFLDWYFRYVVSWELDQTMDADLVLRAASQALIQAKPEIINSDQGSQYTSPKYIQMVRNAGVLISMDGRGRAHANIFTERFWRTLKYEEVYLNEYTSTREARERLKRYFEYYNYERPRPHQSFSLQNTGTTALYA